MTDLADLRTEFVTYGPDPATGRMGGFGGFFVLGFLSRRGADLPYALRIAITALSGVDPDGVGSCTWLGTAAELWDCAVSVAGLDGAAPDRADS